MRIKSYGQKDKSHRLLEKLIAEDWPNKRKSCPKEARDYLTFRDELTEKDRLLYKKQWLVIPALELHGEHQATENMMIPAREIVYWPMMQEDLQKTADQRAACQLNKSANRKEPMLAHKVPTQQFMKVGTDVMYYKHNSRLYVRLHWGS